MRPPTNAVATNAAGRQCREHQRAPSRQKGETRTSRWTWCSSSKATTSKTVPVKIGICDDNYWEITDGLKEGDEMVTGGYHAISRDLDDGKKIVKGAAAGRREKPNSREPDPPPENFAPLPDGHGNRPCAARSLAGNPARRIRRHHGAVRLRQIHADEPGGLPRHADRRHLRTERQPASAR